MANIFNFTPHTLNVVCGDGSVKALPSAGIARVATSVKTLDPVCGFDVVSTTFSDVTGLPDYDPDKYYVVSISFYLLVQIELTFCVLEN